MAVMRQGGHAPARVRRDGRARSPAGLGVGADEGERAFGDDDELAGHVYGGALGELTPGPLRLALMPAEPGDRLEVGVEHDHALLAGRLGDQRVQGLLGWREPAARLPVAVVDDDEGDAGRAADAREQRQVRLTAALDDRDRLPVDVVP